jgi:hypothetical protein
LSVVKTLTPVFDYEWQETKFLFTKIAYVVKLLLFKKQSQGGATVANMVDLIAVLLLTVENSKLSEC